MEDRVRRDRYDYDDSVRDDRGRPSSGGQRYYLYDKELHRPPPRDFHQPGPYPHAPRPPRPSYYNPQPFRPRESHYDSSRDRDRDSYRKPYYRDDDRRYRHSDSERDTYHRDRRKREGSRSRSRGRSRSRSHGRNRSEDEQQPHSTSGNADKNESVPEPIDEEDLSIEIHPLTYFVNNKPRLLTEAVQILKGKRLDAMIPPCLKKLPFKKLESACLKELELMDKASILNVIDGKVTSVSKKAASIKSKKVEEVVTSVIPPKKLKHKVKKSLSAEASTSKLKRSKEKKAAESSSEESEAESKSSKKHKKEKKKKKKKKKKTKSEPTTAPTPANSLLAEDQPILTGRTLMELLELEYRAKAIKALLKTQDVNPNKLDEVLSLSLSAEEEEPTTTNKVEEVAKPTVIKKITKQKTTEKTESVPESKSIGQTVDDILQQVSEIEDTSETIKETSKPKNQCSQPTDDTQNEGKPISDKSPSTPRPAEKSDRILQPETHEQQQRHARSTESQEEDDEQNQSELPIKPPLPRHEEHDPDALELDYEDSNSSHHQESEHEEEQHHGSDSDQSDHEEEEGQHQSDVEVEEETRHTTTEPSEPEEGELDEFDRLKNRAELFDEIESGNEITIDVGDVTLPDAGVEDCTKKTDEVADTREKSEPQPCSSGTQMQYEKIDSSDDSHLEEAGQAAGVDFDELEVEGAETREKKSEGDESDEESEDDDEPTPKRRSKKPKRDPEEEEEETPLTWYHRWYNSKKVQRVVQTNRVFGKLRSKLRKEKAFAEEERQQQNEAAKLPLKDESDVNNVPIIGSIEEYESLFGKQVPPPVYDRETVQPSTSTQQPPAPEEPEEEEEDDNDDLWGDIMGAGANS